MWSKEAERKRQKLFLKYLKEGRVYKFDFKNQSKIFHSENIFLAMDEKQQRTAKVKSFKQWKSHQYFHPTLFSEI